MPTVEIFADYDGYITYDVEAGTYSRDDTAYEARCGFTKGYKYRAFFRFPLESLPENAKVSKVELKIAVDVAGGEAAVWDIHPYNDDGQADPKTDPDSTVYARSAPPGTPYLDDDPFARVSGYYSLDLGLQACVDIENAKAAVNRFSLGIHEEGDNDPYCTFCTTEEIADVDRPRLLITYTVPPVGYQYSDGLVTVMVAG